MVVCIATCKMISVVANEKELQLAHWPKPVHLCCMLVANGCNYTIVVRNCKILNQEERSYPI